MLDLLNSYTFKNNYMNRTLTESFLHELNAEYRATRACIERIPETLFEFKPHPKSMALGYLVLLVAEIPLWISKMIVDGEIDLATFKHASPKTTADLVQHFEDNMKAAREALENSTDESLESLFSLKSNGQIFYTVKKIKDLGVTLNHWVHHRGQLTVYMRLNDLPVPSLYGPSADDKNFTPPS
jgi:uncharacterized damage-inducible protein DinB